MITNIYERNYKNNISLCQATKTLISITVKFSVNILRNVTEMRGRERVGESEEQGEG